jgi:hypothetical protein
MSRLLLWTAALLLTFILSCADYQTLDEMSPHAVVAEVVSSTDSTVTIRWTQSDAEDFALYKVYYSTSDVVDTADKIADTLHFRYDTTKTVSGLDANRQYYFRVIVSTTQHLISASNIVSAWTMKNSSIFELSADSISDTSAILGWNTSRATDFYRYMLYVDTTLNVDTNNSPGLIVKLYSISDTVYNLSNLKRNRSYWMKVHVQNSRGVFISSSNIDSIKTLTGKPDSVTLLKTFVTDDSVGLKWSRSTNANFGEYLVYYDTTAKVDSISTIGLAQGQSIAITNINDTVQTVSSLLHQQQYWFCVYVVAKNGLHAGSNVQVNYPIILFSTAKTDSSITLGWSGATSGRFEAYKIFRSDSAGVSKRSLCITPSGITSSITQSYVDTSADSAHTYFYRLFLYEKNPSTDSGSNEITVKALP